MILCIRLSFMLLNIYLNFSPFVWELENLECDHKMHVDGAPSNLLASLAVSVLESICF